MRSSWLSVRTCDLFGGNTWLERPNVRPDLRNAVTLADQIERERRLTEQIQAGPFKHLPRGYSIPTLATIVSKQETTGVFAGHWLNRHSPAAARHRAHWTPADEEESYPRPYTVQDGQRRPRAS